ncbi:hypothetical protein CDD83_10663 [Cordyceps sp. RAO-2017]|nr:hypothetical protein CDD83_10663 [Cordyceps sp. RAO-2017]
MDAKASSSWMPKGITKSNSTASAGGRSTKSYDSVKVIGGYALGSLHLVRHDDSPRHSTDGDEAHGPPPLDPPPPSSQHLQVRQPPLPRNVMNHGLGGGDIVIVLHLPEQYTVGYDSVSFSTGKFVGIRDVPAGPHFFWAAHSQGTSPRCGFWIMSSGLDCVHVVEWHMFSEVFVQPTRAETRIQAEGVGAIYHKLPPYRDPSAVSTAPGALSVSSIEANVQMWEQLVSGVSRKVLDRLTAEQEDGWNVHTGDRVRGAPRLPAEMELDRTLCRALFQSYELKFSFEQQSRTYCISSFGRDRTLDAIDATSCVLSHLADSPSRRLTEDDIVGEVQFAYIVGAYLGNESCIRQWWFMLLRIVLRAHRLVRQRPGLVAALIRALTAQLTHSLRWMEDSVLDWSGVSTRELRLALVIYKRRLRESQESTPNASREQVDVWVAFTRLESAVAELGWDLDAYYLRRGKVSLEDGDELELELDELQAEDERGEWAPQIVELNEHSQVIGLVSWSD